MLKSGNLNGEHMKYENYTDEELITLFREGNTQIADYIMENYDMSEFVDDAYPNWYLIKDTTVFEQYSEKTNTRVRVDFRNGEFSYFIAGASDNWKKVEGVPLEMDHVIAALIFRSYS